MLKGRNNLNGSNKEQQQQIASAIMFPPESTADFASIPLRQETSLKRANELSLENLYSSMICKRQRFQVPMLPSYPVFPVFSAPPERKTALSSIHILLL
jgi:hypothetical protein